VVEESTQRVEALGPELLVARQPHGGLLQGLRGKFAANHAALFRAGNQAGVFQHAQVLHEPRQRHAVGLRKFGHAALAFAKRQQDVAPGAVGQRGKDAVEVDGFARIGKLNH
jgi:hypothetical protein